MVRVLPLIFCRVPATVRGRKATQAVAVAEVDDSEVEAEDVGAEPQPTIKADSVNKSAAPVARLNSRNASIAVDLLLVSLFGCFFSPVLFCGTLNPSEYVLQ